MNLTDNQKKALLLVCRTNGGGFHAGFNEGNASTRTIRQLERKGLVQGKAGNPSYAVHTSEGLKLCRAIEAGLNKEVT